MYSHDEPVFPVKIVNVEWPGMTLRDYFASQLLGMMFIAAQEDWHWPIKDARRRVHFCYTVADAMLEERLEPEPHIP